MTKIIREGENTPWGEADYVEQIADGIYEVSTPSHGGIMMDVHGQFVKEELSDAAWDVGFAEGGWMCFEEDAAFAVAMWEIMGNDSGLEWTHPAYERDPDRYEDICRESIFRFYPEYAAAAGIE